MAPEVLDVDEKGLSIYDEKVRVCVCARGREREKEKVCVYACV